MLNVCVCVVPLSQPSSRDLLWLNVSVCVVPLSQPSNRDLDYPLWAVHVSEKKMYKDKRHFPCENYSTSCIPIKTLCPKRMMDDLLQRQKITEDTRSSRQ